jgi:DNA polymerase elongation subunit (family B)
MQQNLDKTIADIQKFLEGWGQVKGIVNVETNWNRAVAECFIQGKKSIQQVAIPYTNFVYLKDLKKAGYNFYNADEDQYVVLKAAQRHGVTMEQLDTKKHPRLVNGYPFIIKSEKSITAIQKFIEEGLGLDTQNNATHKEIYRNVTYALSLQEQFFISTGNRLFKGIEDYSEIFKAIFDIETTGLNPRTSRVTHIGVKHNRISDPKKNYTLFEVAAENNNDAEKAVILDFFKELKKIDPAIIAGYNSEAFDFDFLVGRMEQLNDPTMFEVILNRYKKDVKVGVSEADGGYKFNRRFNSSVKFGGSAEKYTSTNVWSKSIIDIHHAVKRAAATNTEIKQTGLKDICKFADITKPDRMYIKGDRISKIWRENKIHIVKCETNEYEEIPSEFQHLAVVLHSKQTFDENGKPHIDTAIKKLVFSNSIEFVNYLIEKKTQLGDYKFLSGKNIVSQYLHDDLWETEQVDQTYNQSSFLLGKIVPTTYSRICTMGTAAVWNLIMTAWSYENGLAIPIPDEAEAFPGGLARCFKKGFSRRIRKLDFAGLYPSLQLAYDIFPSVDVTGALKNLLLYSVTERDKYKKLKKQAEDAGDKKLAAFYDAKQLPLKILNNSMFGALGSNIAFNWGDNICAARITCSGRVHLRKLMVWFKKRGCEPLLAVTDGVNFAYPEHTILDMEGNATLEYRHTDEAWQYGGKTGIAALVAKYNDEELPKPFMKIDDDGSWQSTLVLSRINYANLTEEKFNPKKNKIELPKVKITGNKIKSKVMPEYIVDFIDKGIKLILEGKGAEFVEYYYEYAEKIFYCQIPLKKIATKKRFKSTIHEYLNRGVNKNGKPKNKMAHMELMVMSRNQQAIDLYKTRGGQTELTIADLLSEDTVVRTNANTLMKQIMSEVKDYMTPEPEIGTMLYYVNTGLKQSESDIAIIFDEKLGHMRMTSQMITNEELESNPDLTGTYNVEKYLENFNKKVKSLIGGFSETVQKKLLVKAKKKTRKKVQTEVIEPTGLVREYFTEKELELQNFDEDLLENALFLESGEIDFWNRTGFNPYDIYNGIKIPEDYPLFTNLYDEKLDIVRKAFAQHYPNYVVKSVRDREFNQGDFILFKNFTSYDLYQMGAIKPVPHKLSLNLAVTESEREYIKFLEDRRKPINAEVAHDFLITKMMTEKQIEALEKQVRKFKRAMGISKDTKLSTINEGTGVQVFKEWLAANGIYDPTEVAMDEEEVEEDMDEIDD